MYERRARDQRSAPNKIGGKFQFWCQRIAKGREKNSDSVKSVGLKTLLVVNKTN